MKKLILASVILASVILASFLTISLAAKQVSAQSYPYGFYTCGLIGGTCNMVLPACSNGGYVSFPNECQSRPSTDPECSALPFPACNPPANTPTPSPASGYGTYRCEVNMAVCQVVNTCINGGTIPLNPGCITAGCDTSRPYNCDPPGTPSNQYTCTCTDPGGNPATCSVENIDCLPGYEPSTCSGCPVAPCTQPYTRFCVPKGSPGLFSSGCGYNPARAECSASCPPCTQPVSGFCPSGLDPFDPVGYCSNFWINCEPIVGADCWWLKIYCDANGNQTSNPGTSTNPNRIFTAIGCIDATSTQSITADFLRAGVGVGGGIALLLIAIAAFLIMSSRGDPQRLQAGKELLGAALSGLILLIFGAFALQLIGVQILNIPGFGN